MSDWMVLIIKELYVTSRPLVIDLMVFLKKTVHCSFKLTYLLQNEKGAREHSSRATTAQNS